MVRIYKVDGYIEVSKIVDNFLVQTQLEVKNNRMFMRARKKDITKF